MSFPKLFLKSFIKNYEKSDKAGDYDFWKVIERQIIVKNK